MATLFWSALVLLVLLAAVRLRMRIRALTRSRPLVDDDAIRAIERTGRVEVDDEPLDPRQIEEAERRFWDEERWE